MEKAIVPFDPCQSASYPSRVVLVICMRLQLPCPMPLSQLFRTPRLSGLFRVFLDELSIPFLKQS